ncbi:hypothetical protein Ae201684_017900 [Aphanomyces euteiches]|uniref:Protein kinase domain-containing protein n=1 Tax=Aphanomyces euteiches TaxID=100861 RepID=A0A6G0W7M3_9STRA|nr:hypothetical protein Ae201684_017900 [Aphanomyces euteiches]KAH9157556.1 hypothetical protein AeRB84_000598 [Aphanomyces euteiches]
MINVRLASLGVYAGLAVASVNYNCPYFDLDAAYPAIREYNRDKRQFQVVDRNCTVLNTTKYQAVGSYLGYYEDALSFGSQPVLTFLKASFPDTITFFEVKNTSLKAFPLNWPPKLAQLFLLDMVLDIPAPNVQGIDLLFYNVTLKNTTALNNTQVSSLRFGRYPSPLAFADMDWSNVNNFQLLSSNVSSMSKVRFSKLTGVDFVDANISNWSMSLDSGTRQSQETLGKQNFNFTVCIETSVSPSPEKKSSSLGLIVGLSIGGVVVIGLIAVYFGRKWLKNQKRQLELKYQATETPTIDGDGGVDMTALTLVRLNDADIKLDRMLGSGAFANVWLGTYENQLVAIKRLSAKTISVNQLQAFVDEIKLMSYFDCPHIVTLIGACWTRPVDVKCVMEYMDSGDLKDFLTTYNSQQFIWRDKYLHIQSIIEALVYLHSMDIIHRDLKSRNIVIDSKKGTKLTDFGVSKEDLEQTMTVGVGTFRWMAPEVVQDQRYTTAADIYSFGVVLSEFDTHQIPYTDMKNPGTNEPLSDSAIMVKVVNGSIQPTFTTECPAWIREMAIQCLALDPAQRPTAGLLAHKIRSKLRELAPQLYSI